jgi:hypothetical protein
VSFGERIIPTVVSRRVIVRRSFGGSGALLFCWAVVAYGVRASASFGFWEFIFGFVVGGVGVSVGFFRLCF